MEWILGSCLPHNFQKLEGTVPICSKVGGDASTAVPTCSKVGGDASHGSHRVVAPMVARSTRRSSAYAVTSRCMISRYPFIILSVFLFWLKNSSCTSREM